MLPAPWKQHVQRLPPKPGSTIRVIGAGMPRTGTNSFCAAVSELLDGPAYHVGVQTVPCSDPTATRKWIAVLQARLKHTVEGHKEELAILKEELDGYALLTDIPVFQLVPELVELYPEAVVIVTMRDKQSWIISMAKIIKLVNYNVLKFIFFWIRNLRELPTLWKLCEANQLDRYGYYMTAEQENLSTAWDEHLKWLHEVVPKDRLFFYDVQEGWEPLCKILNRPVPKDKPFPRLNDAKAMDDAFASWSTQGLTMWLVVTSTVVAAISAGMYLAKYL